MFKEKIASFLYLKVFFIVIIALIVGSIIFNIVDEFIESSFRNNSFSVLIVSRDSKFISVDKAGNTAIFLALGDIRSFVKGKKPLEASFALGIPIDAILVENNPPQNLSDFASSKQQTKMLFGGDNITYKNLNRYDIYKLGNIIRGIPKDNKTEIRIDLFNPSDMKEKVGEKLQDSLIINMPLTVEIDNGTSINGLGSDFALILGKKGYNVISVKTSTETDNSFIAYPEKNNEFVDALLNLTHFPLSKAKKSQAADVTIFLGDDLDAMLSP